MNDSADMYIYKWKSRQKPKSQTLFKLNLMGQNTKSLVSDFCPQIGLPQGLLVRFDSFSTSFLELQSNNLTPSILA